MSDLENLRNEFAHVPANASLGFELVSRSPGRAEVAMAVRREHIQENGIVHGGILGALADTACVYALLDDAKPRFTGVEFKVSFLRPASRGIDPVRARASVIRQGRTLAVCSADVLQGEDIVATGLFTYLYLTDDGLTDEDAERSDLPARGPMDRPGTR